MSFLILIIKKKVIKYDCFIAVVASAALGRHGLKKRANFGKT